MQKVIYALGVVTFFGFGGDIAPVLEEPFLGVAAGIRRSFGGNGALWMSFSDSSVFAMCGALRVFEYARMSRACAGMLRFAFWSVVEAGGVCSLKTRYRARRCSGFC